MSGVDEYFANRVLHDGACSMMIHGSVDHSPRFIQALPLSKAPNVSIVD